MPSDAKALSEAQLRAMAEAEDKAGTPLAGNPHEDPRATPEYRAIFMKECALAGIDEEHAWRLYEKRRIGNPWKEIERLRTALDAAILCAKNAESARDWQRGNTRMLEEDNAKLRAELAGRVTGDDLAEAEMELCNEASEKHGWGRKIVKPLDVDPFRKQLDRARAIAARRAGGASDGR